MLNFKTCKIVLFISFYGSRTNIVENFSETNRVKQLRAGTGERYI